VGSPFLARKYVASSDSDDATPLQPPIGYCECPPPPCQQVGIHSSCTIIATIYNVGSKLRFQVECQAICILHLDLLRFKLHIIDYCRRTCSTNFR